MTGTGAPYRSLDAPAVPDHAGDRQPDAVYWTPADPAIGPLLSAWSNQTRDGFRAVRRLGWVRLFAGLFFGGFLALFAIGAGSVLGPIAGPMVGGVGAVALIVWLVLGFRPRPWCNYVGEEGMSDHRVGWRGPRHRLLRFAAADGLWVTRTDHLENGAYRRTVVEHAWLDEAGRVLLSQQVISVDRGLAGAGYRFGARLGGGPPVDPSRDWFEAGARRWFELRKQRLARQLAGSGSATFPLRGGGYLVVQQGALEVSVGADRRTITAGEVERTTWKEGVLTIDITGAKSLRLSASAIADLPLAQATMREVAGIDLGPSPP